MSITEKLKAIGVCGAVFGALTRLSILLHYITPDDAPVRIAAKIEGMSYEAYKAKVMDSKLNISFQDAI